MARMATSRWLRSKSQGKIDNVRSYANDCIWPEATAERRKTKAFDVFTAANLIDVVRTKQHLYTRDDILSLKEGFWVVDHKVEAKLVEERDCCRIAATGVDDDYDLMVCWHDNKAKLPTWSGVAMDALLIPPSSAFMGRFFSTLRNCMDERQRKVFSDRAGAAVLLKVGQRTPP